MKKIFSHWKIILLVLSFFIQGIYIDVGFSLKIFIVVVPFLLLITKRKEVIIPKFEIYEILLLSFYLFEVFSLVYSVHVSSSLRLVKGIVLVAIIYLMSRTLIFRFDKKEVNFGIQWAGIIFASVSLILYFISLSANTELIGVGQLLDFPGLTFDKGVPRLIGTFTDPNIISFYSLFLLLFYINSFKSSLVSKLGFLLILILIILTVSRSFVLAISIVILYNSVNNYKFFFRKEVFISLLIFILIGACLFQLEVVSNIIESRTANIGSASGRIELWTQMWEVFKESPIYGNGAFTSRWLNATLFNNDHYPHNTYLGILIETGFIGFFLFSSSLVALFFYLKKVIKNKPELKWLMNFYIGSLVFIFTLSAIISEIFILFNIVLLRLSSEK